MESLKKTKIIICVFICVILLGTLCGGIILWKRSEKKNAPTDEIQDGKSEKKIPEQKESPEKLNKSKIRISPTKENKKSKQSNISAPSPPLPSLLLPLPLLPPSLLLVQPQNISNVPNPNN